MSGSEAEEGGVVPGVVVRGEVLLRGLVMFPGFDGVAGVLPPGVVVPLGAMIE